MYQTDAFPGLSYTPYKLPIGSDPISHAYQACMSTTITIGAKLQVGVEPTMYHFTKVAELASIRLKQMDNEGIEPSLSECKSDVRTH